MAALSLQSMSKEMLAKLKGAVKLEEVDELMASFVTYVCSHLMFVDIVAHPWSKGFDLIADTLKLVIISKQGSRTQPMECQKRVCGERLQYWRSNISRILNISSLIRYVPLMYEYVLYV